MASPGLGRSHAPAAGAGRLARGGRCGAWLPSKLRKALPLRAGSRRRSAGRVRGQRAAVGAGLEGRAAADCRCAPSLAGMGWEVWGHRTHPGARAQIAARGEDPHRPSQQGRREAPGGALAQPATRCARAPPLCHLAVHRSPRPSWRQGGGQRNPATASAAPVWHVRGCACRAADTARLQGSANSASGHPFRGFPNSTCSEPPGPIRAVWVALARGAATAATDASGTARRGAAAAGAAACSAAADGATCRGADGIEWRATCCARG
jgi:hypothetical protein